MAYKILALHIEYNYMRAETLPPIATVSVLIESAPGYCKAYSKQYNMFVWNKGPDVLAQVVVTNGSKYSKDLAMAIFSQKIGSAWKYEG